MLTGSKNCLMYCVNVTIVAKVIAWLPMLWSPAQKRTLAMQTVPTISMAASRTAS